MHKQDFTNVLDIEIDRLKKLSAAIDNERNIRILQNEKIEDPIAQAVNEKVIVQLEADLSSKAEYIEKLTLKKLVDSEEMDAEYNEIVLKEHKDVFSRISELTDEHDQHYAQMYEKEFYSYLKIEHKEACVYYFNCMKRLLPEVE